LVCGHQRRQQLPANAPVVKTEDHADRTGTVGYGYAEANGVRWPVRFVDWDEVREKAANVAANSPFLAGEFTSDLLPLLDEVREQLPDLHAQLRLGDLAEYAPEPEVQGGQTHPDAVPEPPDEATSKRGEVYQLGNHRLMCADSGSSADLDTLLGGAQIYLVNTDPPYNVKVEPRSNNAIAAGLSSFEGLKHHQRFDLERGKVLRRSRLQETVDALDAKGHHHAAMKLAGGSRPGLLNRVSKKMRPKDRPLENDFVSDEAFEKMLHAWFGNIARVLGPGRSFYIWGGYANIGNYPPVLKACGLYFSQSIIWVKEHPVLTRKDFMGNHEWAFYGWREGAGHKFYGPNNVPDVWPIKKVNPQSMIHLTEKPVELAVRAIQYSSQSGENVLDLFGGSGSSLIACEQTGRKAFLMELDELYCDVIRKRWAEFTNGVGCDWQALTPAVQLQEGRT
jgi:DNA modification methylase